MSSSTPTSDNLNADRLGAVNQKLLSNNGAGTTEFPTVTLAGGETIRTGTIATLLHNIRLYDALSDDAERGTIAEEMRLALPVLKKVGMFDLFSPEEWMSGGKSEGRRLVGQMALEEGIGGIE